MRHRNTAEKEALRVEVFMPDLNPGDAKRAAKFIGTSYDLSLIIHTPGIMQGPGSTTTTVPRCYQLFMHDEVTPGGILIADSCQLPEYYLNDTEVNSTTNVITLIMNNGYEYELDLSDILAKYDATVVSNGDGTYSFKKDGAVVRTWRAGSTYSLSSDGKRLTITAANGTSYVVSTEAMANTDHITTVTYTAASGSTPAHYKATHSDAFSPAVTWYPAIAEVIDDTTVSVTLYNADGTEVTFGVQAASVILNNPTIYIRPTGSAHPNITKQADLTEANAFNSFAAVKAFIATSYIVGSITIDAKGEYTGSQVITATNMKNASSLTIRGDSADATALKLIVDTAADVGSCLNADGIDVVLRDCTLHLPQKNTAAGRFGAALITNGTLWLNGTIRITGNFNAGTGTQNAANALFWAGTGGSINNYGGKIEFALDGAHSFSACFRAADGGSIDVRSNSEFSFVKQLNVVSMYSIGQACDVTAYMTNQPVPVMSGTGKINCTYIWNFSNLATYISSYFAEEFSSSYWPTVNAYASRFADYCVINGAMGSTL